MQGGLRPFKSFLLSFFISAWSHVWRMFILHQIRFRSRRQRRYGRVSRDIINHALNESHKVSYKDASILRWNHNTQILQRRRFFAIYAASCVHTFYVGTQKDLHPDVCGPTTSRFEDVKVLLEGFEEIAFDNFHLRHSYYRFRGLTYFPPFFPPPHSFLFWFFSRENRYSTSLLKYVSNRYVIRSFIA